jgi:ATP-binding protein involved in chromosome partitioning
MTDSHDEVEPPLDVAVEREHGLTLTWADGAVSTYGLEELRVNCPCAACRSLRDRGEPAYTARPGGPPLRIVDAELIGAWGLGLTWSDGHTTGIYPWMILRVWAGPDAGTQR